MKASKATIAGRECWIVSIPKSLCGKRTRIKRTTERDALVAARQFISERQEHGSRRAEITETERDFIMSLRNGGISIAQAKRATSKEKAAKNKRLVQALNEYLLTQKDNSYGHVKSLKSCFNLFSRAFPDCTVDRILPGDIATYLLRNKSNERAIFRRLRAFFRWCVLMSHIEANPMERVPRPAADTSERETFTPAQMEALLDAAANSPQVLRHLVLGGFFGLRTAEIQRLDGKDVDLERGEIFVRKMKTEGKGIRERYVIGTPNAVAWLKNLALPATGPVIEINDKNFRLNRDAVIARANGEDPKEAMKPGAKAEARKGKLIEWPYNVLRRSFASYHLAAFENPNLTAAQMGHTTADTTFAKYRAVRRKENGVAWFAIAP